MPPRQPDPVLACLHNGALTVKGQFMWGSNYTYLARVEHEGEVFQAVYKPTRGERPLWDFPGETLAGREVAAYLVSEALGWRFVPPTVYRRDGPAGPGSLQLYVEHDPEYHYFNFTPDDHRRLRPVALFDAVINNADRKGGHVLVGPDGRLWLIDHGVSFHAQPKLRTVIWDFAGQPIPEDLCQQLSEFRRQLEEGAELAEALSEYLARRELHALAERADRLIESGRFPEPHANARAYPWPPV